MIVRHPHKTESAARMPWWCGRSSGVGGVGLVVGVPDGWRAEQGGDRAVGEAVPDDPAVPVCHSTYLIT